MLDLKYRPQRFSDVVGNAAVVRLLKKLSVEGRLAGRSMMFGGPKGCGKTSLARIVARAIVCDELDAGEPCGECHSCLSVISESADSFEEFDAATQGTVDHMRSIVDGLDYGNLSGKPFVFIMDEAHRLSKQAQDALLKSVEDRRLVVILCTTEPHKIQGAIRSRVTEFPVSAPSESEIVARMEHVCRSESVSFDAGALKLMARSLDFCPRACITTIELLSPSVTLDSVKGHFRYSSLECLASVLAAVDSAPASALESLDVLMAAEGPLWVRDHIVLAISSALRVSVGARPTFPVRHDFFASRGKRWADVARTLGSLDRPGPADIEYALISDCPFVAPAAVSQQSIAPSVSIAAPVLVAIPTAVPAPMVAPAPAPAPTPTPTPILVVPAPLKTAPAPAPAPAPAHNSEIEVEGIKFTHNECLTSLDSRIDIPRIAPVPVVHNSSDVELDRSKIPISEKEFARGLVQRFQKGERP